MATFEELMIKFRTPGDEPLVPETFAEELEKAHTEELSIRDAAVKSREDAAAELQKQLDAAKLEELRLKAVNYDLMVAAPKTGEPENQDNANNDAGDRPRGMAALFEQG